LRLVLDGHQVFPELSVFDNLRLGAAARKTPKAEFDRDVAEMLAVFPILEQKLRARARDLSGGQQQMLALAQAFVVKPSVLLCDEPSTGLAIVLMPPIMNFLKKWAESGTAIVIVEQHMDIALQVADRVMLLERGAIRFSGTAPEFKGHLAGRARQPASEVTSQA
jgi:branched-chain amino acid transport system ATP-binding protein